ncbi:uncharacterized protein LOC129601407 [Paramacrobiotus metropolitanus]|uniref:uncharacterized protein LOC129601407 n=1 Tax=Paramacrobiotus metropolitanus TaxID=2943436 RepID=UPI002445B27D|nr:uncharacterized protein LOC129601407 [Paramacrobiotus metropolitanus]
MNQNLSGNFSLNITKLPVWIIYSDAFAVWTTLSLAFSVISTLASLLLLFAIFHRGIRWGSQMLIANVIVLEALVSAVILPTAVLTSYFPSLRLTAAGCDYYYFFVVWIPHGAQYASLLLAVNRVNAIFCPHRYGQWRNRRFLVPVVALCWIISFSLACGYVGKIGATGPWPSCGISVTSPSEQLFLSVFLTVFGLYIPLAGTCLCYLAIFCSGIWRRLSRCGIVNTGVTSNGVENVQQKRQIIANVLVVSCAVSLLCYLPLCLAYSVLLRVVIQYPPAILWMRLVYYMGYAGNSLKEVCR